MDRDVPWFLKLEPALQRFQNVVGQSGVRAEVQQDPQGRRLLARVGVGVEPHVVHEQRAGAVVELGSVRAPVPKAFHSGGDSAERRQYVSEVDEILPGDDTGSSTYRRYVYQAEVAFPACLRMALDNSPQAVFMEHVEDIVFVEPESPKFIQVKTRDPHRKAWTLDALCNGPLKSLYRAYQRAKHLDGSLYIMALEGPVEDDNALVRYLRGNTEQAEAALDAVARKLETESREDCAEFLKRVRCRDRMPSRDSITGKNLLVIASHDASLTVAQCQTIYGRFMDRIEQAMQSQANADGWYESLLTGKPDTNLPAHERMLTQGDLRPLLAPLAPEGSSRLLKRYTNLDAPPATVLEEKLLAGGATDEIILDAKGLRADATISETEFLGTDEEKAKWDDFLTRLQVRHNQLLARAASHNRPAVQVWNELFNLSQEALNQTDPNRLMNADLYFLVGEICSMADRCEVDFGRARKEATP